VRQYLREGLVDEFELSVAPVLLGDGERLFENVGDVRLEQVRAVAAPGVTHLRYRIAR
jgi:dihydrofolate reductase